MGETEGKPETAKELKIQFGKVVFSETDLIMEGIYQLARIADALQECNAALRSPFPGNDEIEEER